jgi:hypothetical protein
MFDITKYSKQLKVKARSSKSEVNDEKQMFIDLVETFELLNKRSLSVESDHGLKLEKYDGLFYLLIENLFYVHFGEWQTEIILWYVYDRVDDKGNIMPLMYFNEIDNEEKEIKFKNAGELYSFLKKVKRKLKK